MSTSSEQVKINESNSNSNGDARVNACDDYKVSRFMGTVNRLKKLVKLPIKLLPFLILHTLDLILFVLNIPTAILPRSNPKKQHKWTLADKALAFSCKLVGWGEITEQDKAMISHMVEGTYRAPQATDSRSPCPGLNAMANHGK